jgi:hypothetical protein
MNFDKRIWKTGVMAAAITLVAALFVMRLDDWSKGLTSGFIAYGQSGTGSGGTTTGSSGGTGTGTVSITKTLPHLVGGGGYSSVIEVINTSAATESVTASFFDQKGNASTVGYTSSLNGAAPTAFTGSMPGVSLPVNGTLVITLPNAGDTIVNWGNIVSTSTITVAEVFELRDPNNGLISRVGVPASAPNMTSFIIPRFRNIPTRMDVGFAIANTGSTDTTVTVTMRDASGNVLQTTTLPLPKHQQIAAFPSDIFPGLTAPPDATGYGALTFAAPSGQAQLAAIGLAIENQTNSLATFPVDQLQ